MSQPSKKHSHKAKSDAIMAEFIRQLDLAGYDASGWSSLTWIIAGRLLSDRAKKVGTGWQEWAFETFINSDDMPFSISLTDRVVLDRAARIATGWYSGRPALDINTEHVKIMEIMCTAYAGALWRNQQLAANCASICAKFLKLLQKEDPQWLGYDKWDWHNWRRAGVALADPEDDSFVDYWETMLLDHERTNKLNELKKQALTC